MRLPDARDAIVEQEKICDYLLDPAHPDNGGKAAFFLSHGFSREEWFALATAFLGLAMVAEVTRNLESQHGRKYLLDGRIETPDGKVAMVRTVWIVDHGRGPPRLVTAYPHNE